MNFLEAKKIMDEKLGDWKIMALASCVDNYPMVRNVSCVFYNDKIYFKTDKNFRKTQQLFKNPQVAMCFNGVQVEGKAVNKGCLLYTSKEKGYQCEVVDIRNLEYRDHKDVYKRQVL